MKVSGLKKYTLCGWWAILFLLKYDLSPYPKEEYNTIVANLSLPKPSLVLYTDEDN